MSEEPIYFKDAADFNKWLKTYHENKEVLWVGYYKVATGKPSMRWEESVREALCYGWIDGLRKTVDEERYKIRFTPRRANSHWSAKNIRMVEELKTEGRMKEAGLKAFDRLEVSNSGQASYEKDPVKLKKEYIKLFKEQPEAWEYFKNELAPGYTRQSIHWVMSAKQEKTRQKRVRILIESSAKGQKIPLLQG